MHDPSGAIDADALERRRWTTPPMAGSVRGIDAGILNPADPDERRMLIELDHPGPPETWEAAQRLRDLGHERHEILHLLAGAAAGAAWTGMQSGDPVNLNADLRRALGALPGRLSPKGPKRRPH